MNSRRFVTIVATFCLVAGCVTVESGTKFDTSAESRLKIGQTTVADAEAWFGKPTQITQTSNGSTVLVYVHMVAHGNFVGHGSGETETLSLNFGPDNKLRKFVIGGTPAHTR